MARYATRSGARTPKRPRPTGLLEAIAGEANARRGAPTASGEPLPPGEAQVSRTIAELEERERWPLEQVVQALTKFRHSPNFVPAIWATIVVILDHVSRYDDEGATEPTVTPEDTLRAAGIDDTRQAKYQRKMSTLLAGRKDSAAG